MPKIWTILSIDGGGMRGIIPAKILSRLEEQTGCKVSQLFDIIIGTSTGGILAAGLTKPGADGKAMHTARDMVQLYENEGPVIFKKSWLRQIKNYIVGGAKYSAAGIESVLRKYFGDSVYRNQLGRVIIPAFETTLREPWFFKSWYADDGAMLVRDIVRATSAAPTYFDPVRFRDDGCLIDGGLNANSPAMCALAEAIRLSEPGDQFLVVSLGTGKLQTPYSYEQLKKLRPFQWLAPSLSILYDGMPLIADYELNMLLTKQLATPNLQDHVGRMRGYYRFETKLDSSTADMDNASPECIFKLKVFADRLIDIEMADDFNQLCDDLMAIKSQEEVVESRK